MNRMNLNISLRPVRQAVRFVCLMVFVAWMSSVCPADAQAQKKSKKQEKAQEAAVAQEKNTVLNLINKYRSSLGKQPLVMNEIIGNEAYDHSLRMSQGKVPFGHAGFDDRIGKLLKQLAATGGAENVAFSPKGAGSVVHNWLNSDGHRENIEGDYNYAGVGIAVAKNGYKYYTVIFIKKK
jgi:uncharacterized protein YkwD